MPKYSKIVKKAKDIKIAKSFIKAGMNVRKMAENDGISHQAASKRIRENPDVQAIVAKCLKDAGITTKKVYGVIKDQLSATRPIMTRQSGGTDEDDQETTFEEFPDWQARDKAVDKCLKLLDHYPKDTEDAKQQLNLHHVLIQYVDPSNPQKPLLRSPLRSSDPNTPIQS